MSDTKNVKLGVCQVFFKGYDLGYTKGGVEVSVTTETHKVEIDQFGKTAINELIMGRDLKVKVPMAETTLDNMVAIMPGATITETGGTVASGTITCATAPVAGTDTITVNGQVINFVAALTGAENECLIAPSTWSAAAQATLLAAMLNASNNPKIAAATYTAATTAVNVKYGNAVVYGTTGKKGTEGNSFGLVASSAKFTVSGATLTGGTDATERKISVQSATSTDLLSIAKELRLHPQGKADTDLSEDFIVPLAGTGGALSFAYKVDDERVFDVEFTGYPDPVTKVLFKVGGR